MTLKSALAYSFKFKKGSFCGLMLLFDVKLCRMFENLPVHFQQLIIFIVLLKAILHREKTYSYK